MITQELISEQGKSPEEYLASISEKFQDRWMRKVETVEFSEDQLDFLRKSFLPIRIVAISEEWCPDCQNSVPILMKIAELSNFVTLDILERDANIEELQGYTTNGGFRIPFVLFTNEKLQEISRWVERNTTTYKYVYQAKLEALSEGSDDYGKFMREKFREHSTQLFQKNTDEIFNLLKKAVYMRNSSAKLEELENQLQTVA